MLDLRQPTCAEALSPAAEGYLCERLALQLSGAAVLRPCQVRLYQCLADRGSAQALAEDLLALTAQRQSPAGLAAVFECPSGAAQAFDAELRRHLQLLQLLEPRIDADAAIAAEPEAEEALLLRVDGCDLRLIALHPGAGRLARVLPCPVLLFQLLPP